MGRDDMRSVFIGNLADSARNDDVTDFFKGYGKLTDISLKVNNLILYQFYIFTRGDMDLSNLKMHMMLEMHVKTWTVRNFVTSGSE